MLNNNQIKPNNGKRLKVLWVVNHAMPDLCEHFSLPKTTSGSWLVSLLDYFKKQQDTVQVCIASPSKLGYTETNLHGITYLTFPESRIGKYIYQKTKSRKVAERLVNIVNPDLIHFHGTEFPYFEGFYIYKGIPTVTSIQGLVSEIYKNKAMTRFNSYISFFGKVYCLFKHFSLYTRFLSEVRQIKNAQNIIGRTNWDFVRSFSINPNVSYFKVDEGLRNEFTNVKWIGNSLKEETIFFPGDICNPLKGFAFMLNVLVVVKQKSPKIKLLVTGDIRNKNDSYSRSLKKIIKRFDLCNNIQFLGSLEPEEMAYYYRTCSVCFIGSAIENSSNSFIEAQSVGIPIVAPFVGGLPSLNMGGAKVKFYPLNDVELASHFVFQCLGYRTDFYDLNNTLFFNREDESYNFDPDRSEIVDKGLEYLNVYKYLVGEATIEEISQNLNFDDKRMQELSEKFF
ncbi:glycosyltransferase [Idiomarina sp. 29L]|uniref:glycosyltransferase family 4 protein n=1 Tax=Idiomarina sp. 29L TaxID=2508877 RepID=UPI001012738A|nr:glycosyltransferase [Idiomarina sp. 29L]RXS43027.1 glycosyltransferase [Idiomarina sp. 29L]